MSSVRLYGQGARVVGKADLAPGNASKTLTKENTPSVNTEVEVADANLVTSRTPRGKYHLPAIDIDVPIAVIPSSTRGHSHLYIDKIVSWEKYVALLEALADADIVERGYVEACKAHGFTSLRLPWVSKMDEGVSA